MCSARNLSSVKTTENNHQHIGYQLWAYTHIHTHPTPYARQAWTPLWAHTPKDAYTYIFIHVHTTHLYMLKKKPLRVLLRI